MMEQNIALVKDEACPDVEISNTAGLEVLSVSDPLDLPDTFTSCQKSTIKMEPVESEMSCDPESQHLNAICLNIRIAIIRCFYSSSSCPTTALRKLKEEDNALHVTINVEDIDFFVQKFEKTGSVIGNHSMETEDSVNPHSVVETVFHDPFEKITKAVVDNNTEMSYPTNTVFLPTHEVPEEIHEPPQNEAKKRKRVTKTNTKDQSSINSPDEIQQPIISEFEIFICKLCDKRFSDASLINEHILSHSAGTSVCAVCNKSFSSRVALSRHIPSHLTFMCHVCSSPFSKFDILKDHLIKEHDVHPNPRLDDTASDQQVLKYQDECMKCKLCNKYFDRISLLTRHIIEHSKGKPNCALCGQRFSAYNALLCHVRSHTDDKPYRCNKCSCKFTRPDYLKSHLSSKHGVFTFNCEICHQEFEQFRTFKKHMQQNHPDFPISIYYDDSLKYLSIDSGDNRNVEEHHNELSTSNIEPFICRHCRKHFDNIEDLNCHIDDFHPTKQNEESGLDLSIKNSSSRQNSGNQMGNNGVLQHLDHLEVTLGSFHEQATKKSNETQPPFKKQCRICNKEFPSTTKIFTYHVLNHFNMDFLPKDGPHKCPGCHKSFSLNSMLYHHLFHICHYKKYDFSQNQKISESMEDSSFTANSSSEIPKDNNCISSEQSSSSLQDQAEQGDQESDENLASSKNSKKKIHKCPRCAEILPDRRSLTYHVMDHFNLDHLDGRPPYKCPGGCEQLFYKKDSLYKHLVVTCHKGIKKSETPFNCHLCRKSFQHKIQLEHHLLVHSGKAKLKECNFCGKEFNTTSGFRHHLLVFHSETKAYQCDQCPKYYSRPKYLEEHKLIHSGTYLYTCETCGKKCDTSYSYRGHLQSHAKRKVDRWQCEICGKTVSDKSGYKKHMRIHTGEMVADCDLCGKSFNRRDNLRTHYRSCQKQMLNLSQDSSI